MKNIKYASRKKTPWSDSDNITPLEQFIKDNYELHFNQRHPLIIKAKEAQFLNEITANKCRYCGSNKIIRKGINRYGLQRYYCKDCTRKFTVLTNTIFENHKISISEWIEYLLYLFGFESLSEISKNNKNSPSTTKYWLKKVFLLLENYQDNIVLRGNIYIDETFYKDIRSSIDKDQHNLMYRGLSHNQFCIGVGFDGCHVYCKVEGRGKPSMDRTLSCFNGHIESRSHLIHDKEKSHEILISTYSLTSEAYDGNDLKKLDDKDNPLDPINKVILFLKKYLNAHPGFDRNDLQNYLNLFSFIMNESKSPLEKVKKMVYLSLNTTISLKYRDFYNKKGGSKKHRYYLGPLCKKLFYYLYILLIMSVNA